jgi:uncharacterized membrane protein YfcA
MVGEEASMPRLALVVGLVAGILGGACATGGDRPAPPAPGSGLGSRCSTTAGTVCFLKANAALESACVCDDLYGRQAGKVVP